MASIYVCDTYSWPFLVSLSLEVEDFPVSLGVRVLSLGVVELLVVLQ